MSDRDPPEVLLVEDNPGDVRLFQLAAVGADVPLSLRVAADVPEALEVLREDARADGPPPVDLVVLDLDLGEGHGTDVLREIRGDPAMEILPVLVLSSEADAEVIEETYELGANAHLEKRMDYAETRELVERIAAFWLKTVELPEA